MNVCLRLIKEGRFHPQSPGRIIEDSYQEILNQKQPLIGEYSKTCLKWPLKRKPIYIGFKTDNRLMQVKSTAESVRMLPLEHSAVLLTCFKLPHGFQTFVLSIFEWPLKTGFTVFYVVLRLDFRLLYT